LTGSVIEYSFHSGSLQLAALHVVEGEAWSFAVFAHPQPNEAAHVLRAEEPAELNRRASKVNLDVISERGEIIWAIGLALDSSRQSTAVHNLVVCE